jgi:prepilin-type N-terminal cleavage/methylation domain-containing protein
MMIKGLTQKSREKTGMTLVEVLITLAIVVTIFAPIMSMISLSTLKAYRGGDRTVATIYANDLLEIIRGAPYDAFVANDQWMTLKQVLYEHNIPSGYFIDKYDTRFSLRAKVSNVEGYPARKIKWVTVECQWKRRTKGETKSSDGKELANSIVLISAYTPTE